MATKKDRRADAQPVDDDRRAGRDRRQWERVLVDFEVDYGAEDTFLFAYITDISAMGIFVRTHAPEAAGTLLRLRFCPPGHQPFECEGVVIWVNPYRPGDHENLNPGMGIRFEGLTYDQREQVKELVRTFAYLSRDDDDDDEDDKAEGAEEEDDDEGRAPDAIETLDASNVDVADEDDLVDRALSPRSPAKA